MSKDNQTTTAGRSSQGTIVQKFSNNFLQNMGIKSNKPSRVKSAAHYTHKKKNINLKYLRHTDNESPTDRIPLDKRSTQFMERVTNSSLKTNNYFVECNTDKNYDQTSFGNMAASTPHLKNASRPIGQRFMPNNDL